MSIKEDLANLIDGCATIVASTGLLIATGLYTAAIGLPGAFMGFSEALYPTAQGLSFGFSGLAEGFATCAQAFRKDENKLSSWFDDGPARGIFHRIRDAFTKVEKQMSTVDENLSPSGINTLNPGAHQ